MRDKEGHWHIFVLIDTLEMVILNAYFHSYLGRALRLKNQQVARSSMVFVKEVDIPDP